MEDPIAALADIKPLTRDASVEELASVLGRHRAALLEVAGDTTRTHERVERLVSEMGDALKLAKRNETAEHVPLGGPRELDRLFLRGDGSVQLGRGVEQIELPDGSKEQVVRHGLLTWPVPVTPEHDLVQRTYAGWAIAANRARRSGLQNVFTDLLARRAYLAFRKAMMNLPGRVGDFCRSVFTDPATFKRVIDKTSGTGGELIPVPTTADIRRPAMLQRRVVGLIGAKPAPARSFKPPIVTGHPLAKKRGATVDDPARYSVSTWTTSDVTLTVIDQVIMSLLDPLWVSDAAAILDDPMGEVVAWLEQGFADTLEAAFLHGDTAGTHQDTIASWTLGGYYSAGDLDGSDAALKWWIGLRARAVDDSNTASGGGTFDAADHYGALNLLGTLAYRAACITGLNCLYTQLLSNSLFTTVDKFGDRATLITGQLGSIGDTPLVISEFMPKQFDTSSGVYTGSNLGNEMVYFNPEKWAHYELAGGDDFDATYPEKGARYVGMVRRSILAPTCLSTEKPVALVYNL